MVQVCFNFGVSHESFLCLCCLFHAVWGELVSVAIDEAICFHRGEAFAGDHPAKLAVALSRVAFGELSHKINLLKEQKAQKGTLVTGRQILLMVHQHYKISATDGALLKFQDLLEVKLHNDDLRSFLQDWETVLTQMNIGSAQ